MLIQKTVRAKIISLTRRKAKLLTQEFAAFQACLHGQPADLYSATCQQAERLRRELKRLKHKQYPMILRHDTVKLQRQQTKLTFFWFKIPVAKVQGGIWVAIRVAPSHEPLLELEIRETKLVFKRGNWYLLITVRKEVEIAQPHNPVVLAVDLGERVIATSVTVGNDFRGKAHFYGKGIRGIRRHYRWLRARLGKRKLLSVIKRIGNTEKRKVHDRLHKISRAIVNEALALQREGFEVVIAIGNVAGHRKGNKGRRFNRSLGQMPSHTMRFMIQYKAAWDAIPIMLVNEAHTSQICHRCGQKGSRRTQALFVCSHCGLQYNADLNGALNIAHRLRCQVASERGYSELALNPLSFKEGTPRPVGGSDTTVCTRGRASYNRLSRACRGLTG